MSGGAGALPPVRVERALGLLPDLEVLNPLRGLLVSISRPDERTMWSSSGPYLTLGKRGVQPEELRRHLPPLLHRIAGHMRALYDAYAEALECQQRGDGGAEGARDARGMGRVERSLAMLARKQGDLTTADVHLRRARELVESVGAADAMAQVLNGQGQLDAQLGRHSAAYATYREALAWAQR